MQQSLERLIQQHSTVMAQQMVEVAKWAKSEEDVRHECNKLIDDFLVKAGITLKGRHEYGLAGGRIDSKYGGVIIEYKGPKGSGKLTETGVKAVVQQILQRFKDFKTKENIEPEKIFAVGCDGKTLVFVRYRGNELEVSDPLPVTRHTVERLLRALLSLGVRGHSFTPDNLCSHFGAGGGIAELGVRRIYKMISTTDNAKAKTFFKQWQILFGEVCGYDIHGRNAKISELGEHYTISKAKPAELLFSVHTYYGLLIKLLAAEIVSSFSPLGISAIKKLVATPTSAKLRSELDLLEQGGIWSQIGIRNFLEGDLFSWYLAAWDDNCEAMVRQMVNTLDGYDPSSLSVDPTESRDLLKKLYQHLFPKSVRHDFGEYYTPDWLAQLTLNELRYDGNPDKRLLDPACGSGTFLVMTINRIRAWYDEHCHECGFREDELLNKILSNVIGFDLNPLAVMAARTNYLMAIRDLLPYASSVELPVYLCDSIMTPSMATAATEIHGSDSKTRETDKFMDTIWTRDQPASLKTAVGTFLVPKEVAWVRNTLGNYANILESCIRNRYSIDEFLERCQAEGVPTTETERHRELYTHLLQLDVDNKNGIWARIIKNAFAPLFVERVDYVIGNPPWINWESLPEEYRASTLRIIDEYGLRPEKGQSGKMRGAKKDLSMLFVYVCADKYLVEHGRLGFVITQSLFKTHGAGDGFRQFQFPRGSSTAHLKPTNVLDLSAIQVFDGATNRTAVFTCTVQKTPFKYPIKYTVWRGPSRIAQETLLEEAIALVQRKEMGALPVDPDKRTSPWLTASPRALPGLQKAIGQSHYRAHEGVNTGGLNGVYWIKVLKELRDGNLLVQNLHIVGKKKVDQHQAAIEPDLVFPLLRGRDVTRWHANPSSHIIITQDRERVREGIPETEMKKRYPKTFDFLNRFRKELSDRPDRKYYPTGSPFYTMRNVADYTMAEWKVLWPEVGHSVRAGVCGPSVVEKAKPSLPDHTIVAVSCGTGEEAFFVAGLLNSSPAHLAAAAYIVLHPSPHIMQNIAVPKFKKTDIDHTRLAELSRQCHVAAAENEEDNIKELEAEIDKIAGKIWDITTSELKAIQKAVADMSV